MPTNIIHTTPDCEIISTRMVDAPIERVYAAWSDPEQLKKWWGPAGFTNTFHEFNFSVGGKWIFTMHGPDKGHYENECKFIKIEKPSLIAWQRYSKPIFQVVAMFKEESAERTTITFNMLFNTANECNKLKPFVVDKNEENFDRLEKVLAEMP